MAEAIAVNSNSAHSQLTASQRPLPRLSAQDLAALKPVLHNVTRQAGERICEYGEEADSIYFIFSGRVKFYHVTPAGEELPLEEIGVGAFFGEVAALYGGKRTASARATDLTTLLELKKADLDDFLLRYPHVVRLLLEGMAQRLSRSGDQLRYAPLRNANEVAARKLTPQDRLIMRIAAFLGSGGFLAVFAAALVVWGFVNHWTGFDTGLVWLALTLSVVQIVISNFVLNSQNRAADLERIVSDTEYEANMHAEKEVRALHRKLDSQHAELLQRLSHIEAQNQQHH